MSVITDISGKLSEGVENIEGWVKEFKAHLPELDAEAERCKKTIRVPGGGLQKLYSITGRAMSAYRAGGEEGQTTADHHPPLEM